MEPVAMSSKRPRLSVAPKMASSRSGSPAISLPSLADLPDNILVEICRNLPMAARMRMRRVNSCFYKIVPQSMDRIDLVGESGLLAYSFGEKASLTKATAQQTTYKFAVRQAAPSLIRMAGSNLTAANFYYSRDDQSIRFGRRWQSPLRPWFFKLLMSFCPNLKTLELNINLTNNGIAFKLSEAFANLTCLKVDNFEASQICHFRCLRRLSVEEFDLPRKDHSLSPGIIESYQRLSGIEIRSNIVLGDHTMFYLSIASRVTACRLSFPYPDWTSWGDSCLEFLSKTKALVRLTLCGHGFLPSMSARLRDLFDSELTCLNDLTILFNSGFDNVLLSSSLENLKSFNAQGLHKLNIFANWKKLKRCKLGCLDNIGLLNQLNLNAPLTHFEVRKTRIAYEEESIVKFLMTRRYPLEVCHFEFSGKFLRCDDVSVFMTRHKSTLRELIFYSMIDLEPGFFKHECFFPNLQLADSPKYVLKRFGVTEGLFVKETVSIHDLKIAIKDFVEARARWMTEQVARFGKYSRVELSMILNLPSKRDNLVSDLFRKFPEKKLNSAGIVLFRRHMI